MKTKKYCLVCGEKKFRLTKKIGENRIYECVSCSLAVTQYGKKTKKSVLYGKKGMYNLKNYQSEEKRQSKKFKEIASVVKNFVRQGKVLEVGAGYGLFASLLVKNKYKLNVVEPHLKLIYLNKLKNKVKISTKTYEQFLRANKERFDLITFIDVLEHFKNPEVLFKKTSAILLDQGLVLILLPNHRSLMQALTKNWSWWMTEDHKYHFSSKSIKQFLINNNFEIKYFATFENWYDFRKNLDGNFTHIKDRNRRRMLKGIFFAFFIPLYFALRKIMWKLGYGGELCVVASKS